MFMNTLFLQKGYLQRFLSKILIDKVHLDQLNQRKVNKKYNVLGLLANQINPNAKSKLAWSVYTTVFVPREASAYLLNVKNLPINLKASLRATQTLRSKQTLPLLRQHVDEVKRELEKNQCLDSRVKLQKQRPRALTSENAYRSLLRKSLKDSVVHGLSKEQKTQGKTQNSCVQCLTCPKGVHFSSGFYLKRFLFFACQPSVVFIFPCASFTQTRMVTNEIFVPLKKTIGSTQKFLKNRTNLQKLCKESFFFSEQSLWHRNLFQINLENSTQFTKIKMLIKNLYYIQRLVKNNISYYAKLESWLFLVNKKHVFKKIKIGKFKSTSRVVMQVHFTFFQGLPTTYPLQVFSCLYCASHKHFLSFSSTVTPSAFFIKKKAICCRNQHIYPFYFQLCLINCLRPLFVMTRLDTFYISQLLQLPVYPDKSNLQIKFLRNRVRKQILPAMRTLLNPQCDIILCKLSTLV